jgi:hypothetical protein
VPEQEFDLLQITTILPAGFDTGERLLIYPFPLINEFRLQHRDGSTSPAKSPIAVPKEHSAELME